MDHREKQELFDKLDHATNEELGQLAKFTLRLNSDPFEAGARALELPSKTREKVLTALKALIKSDSIAVAKMNL
jgi:hypothetical protein